MIRFGKQSGTAIQQYSKRTPTKRTMYIYFVQFFSIWKKNSTSWFQYFRRKSSIKLDVFRRLFCAVLITERVLVLKSKIFTLFPWLNQSGTVWLSLDTRFFSMVADLRFVRRKKKCHIHICHCHSLDMPFWMNVWNIADVWPKIHNAMPYNISHSKFSRPVPAHASPHEICWWLNPPFMAAFHYIKSFEKKLQSWNLDISSSPSLGLWVHNVMD